MARVTRVEGLDKLMKDIEKVDNLPKKVISKGARNGAKIILTRARQIAKARWKTGKMSKKITLKAENNRPKRKKVFRVQYPSTEQFPEAVKVTKDGKQYYYPASQNYGFQNKYMSKKVKGLKFFETAFEEKSSQAARVMVEEIGKQVEDILKGRG